MSESYLLEVVPVGPLQVNAVILGCRETGCGLVIDAGEDPDRLLALIERHQLKIEQLVNTHGHFDHVGANAALQQATKAPLAIHTEDQPLLALAPMQAASYGLEVSASPEPDRLLQDGDEIKCGKLCLQVLHTPGHSPGGICLYLPGLLISGDTLFAGSVGRTDLPGGSMDQLLASIRTQLLGLPPETRVIPGHGPETSIARELRQNPYLH